MSLPALYPGVVKEYRAQPRYCTVEIPGFTDGAEQFPEADIMQSLGDRSEDTEVRIKPGDRVWLSFFNGDSRYPIIVGFRAKNQGNNVGTRHWEHENFDLQADQNYNLAAGENITLTAGTMITLTVGGSKVEISASTIAVIAAAIQMQGVMALQGQVTQTGGMTSDGINVPGHKHTSTAPGTPTSAPIP